MILSAMLGAATLIAAISVRACLLPTVSISQAVFSVSSRIISSSMRASAIQSRMFDAARDRLAERHALGARAAQSSSSARSAAPIVRMQWWMRPGPRRAWLMRKPSPSPAMRFSAGTRTSSKSELGVALLVLVAEDGQAALDGDARRVARDEHHALLAVARGLRRRLAHHDEDPAVRVQRPGRSTTCGR